MDTAKLMALADHLDDLAIHAETETGGSTDRDDPAVARLKGKRYGYSHAAQLLRAAIANLETR